MKNKRGWIKIVEAFVAILLLVSILVIFITSKSTHSNEDKIFYEKERLILTQIQINETLRNLVISSNPPINSTEINFPQEVFNVTLNHFPQTVDCLMKICSSNSTCNLDIDSKNQIYVQERIIVGNSSTYSPKTISLGCY